MSIIGLTDKPLLRRDGKIRAGYKDESGKLFNTEHFLFDDAPQLAGIYGETATEVLFTVHSDNPSDFMKTDLRWYNSSQLMCLSMHNAPGEDGKPMGSVAAYFGTGADVQGLQQKPFPGIQKARQRGCLYKSCPHYVQNKCSEHMFFDMIIPQFSMGALFTLDTTSINAIINAHSTFQKAWTRYGGKLTGQIFRMYKGPGEIKYDKKDGSQGKREAPMVYFDMVNFEEYEAKYRDSIRHEDWMALINLREGTRISSGLSLAAPVEDVQALGHTDSPQISAPASVVGNLVAQDQDPDFHVKQTADDPTFVKLANELAALKGLDPVKDAEKITGMRMATVRSKGMDLKAIIAHMQKSIKEAKKQQQVTAPPPQEQQLAPATNASAQGGGLY